MTPEQLDEFLEVLRDHSVAEFSCPEFSVSLLPSAPSEKIDMAQQIKEGNSMVRRTVGRGLFAHPKLWPGGEAPQFPKKQPERTVTISEGDD